jgi:hypothetical protein
MTTFAFLFDVAPERFHTLSAPDVETAGTEAAKAAAAAQANMEGTGTFVVWLIPIEDVTIYKSQVTVAPGYNVTLTQVSPQDALG